MSAKFEKVSKYIDKDIKMPVRKTAISAGYDMVVAKDTVIPSFWSQKIDMEYATSFDELTSSFSLKQMADLTKKTGAKPILVPTGMKCKLDPNTYLELSVRSSCPLKHWLIMANGVGIIDADYYNNPDNEGEIFFQLINLSPYDIILKEGDTIGQGIIKPYLTTEDDVASGKRTGGFGSTDEK